MYPSITIYRLLDTNNISQIDHALIAFDKLCHIIFLSLRSAPPRFVLQSFHLP